MAEQYCWYCVMASYARHDTRTLSSQTRNSQQWRRRHAASQYDKAATGMLQAVTAHASAITQGHAVGSHKRHAINERQARYTQRDYQYTDERVMMLLITMPAADALRRH